MKRTSELTTFLTTHCIFQTARGGRKSLARRKGRPTSKVCCPFKFSLITIDSVQVTLSISTTCQSSPHATHSDIYQHGSLIQNRRFIIVLLNLTTISSPLWEPMESCSHASLSLMTPCRNTFTNLPLGQELLRLLSGAFLLIASDVEAHSTTLCLPLLESGGLFAWFVGGVDGLRESMYVITHQYLYC